MYIVTLKDGLKNSNLEGHLDDLRAAYDSTVDFAGIEAFKGETYGYLGYTGTFTPEVVHFIRNQTAVESVEQSKTKNFDEVLNEPGTDSRVEDDLKFVTEPVGLQRRAGQEVTQRVAPHNLRDISHRFALRSWEPSFLYKYYYNTEAGSDTYAYVVDSGVRITHKQFEGRAEHGWSPFRDQEDRKGHGTHVAGIIASKTYGVVKKARIISVKVTQEGAIADHILMKAVNWIMKDVQDKGRIGKAVINMSLSVGRSESLDRLIRKAFDAGVLTVAAAGNKGDCDLVSPADSPKALTVASINTDWSVATFCKLRSTVALFAPGAQIRSLTNRSDSGYVKKTGTSMAAPHVAGLVLNAMSVHGIRGAQQITDYLKKTATSGQIKGDLNGLPNLVANNNNPKQRRMCDTGSEAADVSG
ncbi:hypothetical protein CDD83_5185 [Cordyceps sp. RAO-2017]|nr:hypothetical protein CDD83_5185 [Cordyceps sp. RAO-2017]